MTTILGVCSTSTPLTPPGQGGLNMGRHITSMAQNTTSPQQGVQQGNSPACTAWQQQQAQRANYYRFSLASNAPRHRRHSPSTSKTMKHPPGDQILRRQSPTRNSASSHRHPSIQHGMRFPASTVNDNELFLLPTDGAPGTYTDEDGNEQTSALSGDIFQYSHTTARWTRIYTNQHRPIPSATVGNTDPFPVGANNKIAFERAPQDGLPTYAARLANSIILNSDGRPIVYTGGQQIPLAFDADVLHRGEAPFPARQALIERERDDVRFQTEEHVAAVRLDQTMTFGAWTLADWSRKHARTACL